MEQVKPNINIWSTGPFDLRNWVRCCPMDISFAPEWQDTNNWMSYNPCNCSCKCDKMPTSEVPIIKILLGTILTVKIQKYKLLVSHKNIYIKEINICEITNIKIIFIY